MEQTFAKLYSILRKLVYSARTFKKEEYIFYITIFFYLFLWFANPVNKIIALSYFVLILIYNFRLRDLKTSLLLAYLASTIVDTGKTYIFQLVPPGIYDINIWPFGYNLIFALTPGVVLICVMAVILFRDAFKSLRLSELSFTKTEFLIVFYFGWVIFSDIIASRQPEVSLLFNLSNIFILVVYFYIKIYKKNKKEIINLVISLLASLVLFEAFISVEQFISDSPVFKNIEEQVNIEYWGKAPDEIEFTFRPVGTFIHANVLGYWLAFLLVIIFIVLFFKPFLKFFVTFGLGSLVLGMTLSRSSWLGFSIAMFFSLYVLIKLNKRKLPDFFSKYKILIGIMGCIMVVYFFVPRVYKTLYSFGDGTGGGYLRSLQIRTALSLILQRPLFGVGTGMGVLAASEQDPSSIFARIPLSVHNWYVFEAVEHGAPAVVLFLLYVFLATKPAILKLYKMGLTNYHDFFRLGVILGILSLLVVGLFQPFMDMELILISLAFM